MKILHATLVLLALLTRARSMDGIVDGENDGDITPLAIKPTNKCRSSSCEIAEIDETGLHKDFIKDEFLTVQLSDNLPKRRFKKVMSSTIKTRGDNIAMDSKGNPDRSEKIWYGEDGDATMTLMKREGRADGEEIVVGSMVDADYIHNIARNAAGKPIVKTRKISDFKVEADPLQQRRNKKNLFESHEEENNRVLLQSSLWQDASSKGSRSNDSRHCSLQSGDSGDTIDVLVVWTKNAECRQSDDSPGCTLTQTTTDNMLALVDLAIEETNIAFELSGIDTRLRLVHAYLEADYQDSGNVRTALEDVTDNKIGQVHAMREEYGADIVSLMIDTGDKNYCGIAWLGPRKDLSFSVVSFDCASGNFSFGHEIAHNMGCNHDKGTEDECDSTNSNYGYRDPQAEFRSIMSYNCTAGQCDQNAGGGCPRVLRFSNKENKFNGKKIGDEGHDNASQINRMKTHVANYYQSIDREVCTSDDYCDDGDACTTNTCINGECEISVICPTLKQQKMVALLDANSGNAGNMFKVKAKELLVIKGIGIHTRATGPVHLEVWTRRNYYYAIGDSVGWSKVQQVTVTGKGEGVATPVPLFDDPVPIRKDEVQAFYVTLNSTDIKYTRGTEEGAIRKQNNELIFYEGIGVKYPFGGSDEEFWSPRIFNGPIKYALVERETLKIEVEEEVNCRRLKGWYVEHKGNKKKCPWVGRKPKRCKKVGVSPTGNMTGYDACPKQCRPEECPSPAPVSG